MTLDQIIIDSEVLQNIQSERKKTHFLQYALKIFKNVFIIGNSNQEYIQNFYISTYNQKLKIIQNDDILNLLAENEIEPENVYIMSQTEYIQYQAEELQIEYTHQPTNLDQIIKKLNKK